MKRIGIITLVNVNNYGAELQAFATQHSLQKMGFDAEIIDYPYFINSRHKKTKGSKPKFKMPLKLKLIVMLHPLLQWYKTIKQDKSIRQRREENFKSFHDRNTKFSCEYRTAESLVSCKTDYDMFVVGSDQVWNPNNYTSLDPYFLKFAPKGKRKISYASSFGVGVLPEHTRDYYKEALRGLDAISVREENAVQMVEEISNMKAQWVLDPTLLLSGTEWKRYEKALKGMPENFVLIYEVTPCEYVKNLAMNVAEQLGYRVVRINCDSIRCENDDEIINVLDAGPAEFIWLFSQAKMVVTNSFHGAAFSLNMQKDFFVVSPERKKNNSRQKSLLRMVNLEHRMIVEGAHMPKKESFSIDYAVVNSLLEAARDKSKNYLINAINGE